MQWQPHRLQGGLDTQGIEPGLPLPLQATGRRRASLPLQRALHLHRLFARRRQVFNLQGHRRHVKDHRPDRQFVRKTERPTVQGEIANQQRPWWRGRGRGKRHGLHLAAGACGGVAHRLWLQPLLKHPATVGATANRHPWPLEFQLAQDRGSGRQVQL